MATLALALFAALIALTACQDDLGPSGGWSGIVQNDELIYIGNSDGEVVRVNPDTLALDRSWKFPITDDVGEIYSAPVFANGTAYGTGYNCTGNTCDGEVFAINLENGSAAWSYEVKTKLIGVAGIGDTTLAVGTTAIDEQGARGNLLGLSMEQDAAREKWRLPVDGGIWGGVVVADNIAYFGTMGGTLYAVDLADSAEYQGAVQSRILWSFDTGGAIAGRPLLADGKVYFGSFNESVYALDLEFRAQNPTSTVLDSGSEWSFSAGAWVWATPAINEGSIYVANIRGQVFALDLETASEQWALPAQAGEEVVAQPVVFEGNRGPSLAVPSGEGGISVVILSSGQVSGEFSTNGKGVKSSPVVIGDSLFAHSDNSQLWKFDTGTLALSGCIDAKGDGNRCG